MKYIVQSKRFKKDFKRSEKRGCKAQDLEKILDLLVNDQSLPDRCRPHRLTGEYSSYWECHITPDWLMIYRYDDDTLELVRNGTHADLFN